MRKHKKHPVIARRPNGPTRQSVLLVQGTDSHVASLLGMTASRCLLLSHTTGRSVKKVSASMDLWRQRRFIHKKFTGRSRFCRNYTLSYACTKRNDLPLFSPSPFFKHTQAEDPDPYPGQGLLSSWDRGPAFLSLRGGAQPRRGNPSPQTAMFTKSSFRRHDSAAIIRYSMRVLRKKSRYFSYYSLSFTNTHRQTALTTSPVRAVCRLCCHCAGMLQSNVEKLSATRSRAN